MNSELHNGKCEMCGENAIVENINGSMICEKCFSKISLLIAADEGCKIWINESISKDSAYDDAIDQVVNQHLLNIKKLQRNCADQIISLKNALKEEIKVRIQFYRRDEFFAVLFSIKEYIRRYLLRCKRPQWNYINDISTVNILMKIASEVTEYENHAIYELERGCSNLANVICWARRYNLVTENYNIVGDNVSDVGDLCFESALPNEADKYFDLYLENGVFEKIEDYTIKNEFLRNKLSLEEKTPESILNAFADILSSQFLFSAKDLKALEQIIFKYEFKNNEEFKAWVQEEKELFSDSPIYVIEKELLEKTFNKSILEANLNTFSINKHFDSLADYMELFCFFEVDDFVMFGGIDVVQTFGIFEKFLLSGHYIEAYKKGISSNKIFTKAQRNMSKFFSYCVADLLANNGYILPTEIVNKKECIRAEIDKIEIENENILKDSNGKALGDIDVLAINIDKKEILLFELKYYKPAISIHDLFVRDKSLIVDKRVLEHIQAREKAISSHKRGVVKYILGKCDGDYRVRSFLLTARTNYYGLIENEVEYITWAELVKKVEQNRL